jgi:phytoene synthase
MPSAVRPAMKALFDIDAAMGEVVARSTDPTLGRIKLAWWREQLEALDEHAPPAEPRLAAVAAQLLSRGMSGAEVAELEAGWATLLDHSPDPALVASRGTTLFELGGRLLGARDQMISDAGALFALQATGFREQAHDHLLKLHRHRFPRALRPLTMLARAAALDLGRQSDRGRVLAMLAHRWSGRIA